MNEPKLGYIILYVPDVSKAVEFYQEAFGLAVGFAHESGTYTELATGETALAFAEESSAPCGQIFAPNRLDEPAAGAEIALVFDSVEPAYERALAVGATTVVVPEQKPWGQTVGYVRDLNGVLVELCTPVGG